jgi:hypothetical protein
MDTTRHRRLRLSLRVLMLLIAVVGLGLGWLVNKIHRQRTAKAFIEANGGRVGYDRGFWDPLQPNPPEPPGPRWLRRLIGGELFEEIAMVGLDFSEIRRSHASSSEVLEWTVRGASRITILDINHGDLSDAAYRAIGKLTALEVLALRDEDPTDAQISYLASLKRLRILEVYSGSRLTDNALASISKLPNLKSLTICPPSTPKTKSGFRRLSGCTGRRFTDWGLESLSHVPKLEDLAIGNLFITDRGLEHLSHLHGLKNLCLCAQPKDVSAAGLQHLRGISSLERLTLYVGNWHIETLGTRWGGRSPADAIDAALAESLKR